MYTLVLVDRIGVGVPCHVDLNYIYYTCWSRDTCSRFMLLKLELHSVLKNYLGLKASFSVPYVRPISIGVENEFNQ